eukprot:COSAG01_NODE_7595_length_3133_cov_31.926170_4_plen_171_part_00
MILQLFATWLAIYSQASKLNFNNTVTDVDCGRVGGESGRDATDGGGVDLVEQRSAEPGEGRRHGDAADQCVRGDPAAGMRAVRVGRGGSRWRHHVAPAAPHPQSLSLQRLHLMARSWAGLVAVLTLVLIGAMSSVLPLLPPALVPTTRAHEPAERRSSSRYARRSCRAGR